MYMLQVQQQLFTIGEKYFVKDELGNDKYYAEGSVMQIPKEFVIYDNSVNKNVLAKVVRVFPSFILPRFELIINGEVIATIEKELTLFKPKYRITGSNIVIKGDLFAYSYEIFKDNHLIGKIDRQWFKFKDIYDIGIEDRNNELLVIGIILGIDYVRRLQQNNN